MVSARTTSGTLRQRLSLPISRIFSLCTNLLRYIGLIVPATVFKVPFAGSPAAVFAVGPVAGRVVHLSADGMLQNPLRSLS